MAAAMHPGSCSPKATLARGGDREEALLQPEPRPEAWLVKDHFCAHFFALPNTSGSQDAEFSAEVADCPSSMGRGGKRMGWGSPCRRPPVIPPRLFSATSPVDTFHSSPP